MRALTRTERWFFMIDLGAFACSKMSRSLVSGRYTQIRDDFGDVGEVVDTDSMARTTLNNFTKPWGPFVRGIVAREVMLTWERMWDYFVQEETRLVAEASGQQQTV
jgi:hypothetical protein